MSLVSQEKKMKFDPEKMMSELTPENFGGEDMFYLHLELELAKFSCNTITVNPPTYETALVGIKMMKICEILRAQPAMLEKIRQLESRS